ncbi:MAG: GCN5-related N-acetyltransferase [Firmicutes bacterium]|nr:GCN5-related N-acetyltransferase [Bacillota bacterium]
MISLEPIKLADLEQYAALAEELFDSKTNMLQLEKMVKLIIANPDYILVGAKDKNNQLLGSVMGITCIDTVGECRPFMVLENLIVSKESRRHGIGKILVSYIEEHARKQNCYFIMLMSLTKRKDAHSFYESVGYSKTISYGFKKYL